METEKENSKNAFLGEIRPLNFDNKEEAKKVADFFNAIDVLWPGTFTQGMKFNEQRAKEFITKRRSLVNFVALSPDGRIVGFCSVHQRREEKNVSYIGLLGVHPDFLGKKYGKNLLLRALEYSISIGDQRQDLNTWPSNMKAVPLYKKVGLQWVPETSVYMQNYIPAILQNSFCRPFFNKHPSWYSILKREITQAPDDQSLGNMKVFRYYFEEGGDSLEVIIDRYSRTICGITRKIDGKSIGVLLKQHKHEIFTGEKNVFSIEITNNTGKEIPIILDFKTSKKIKIQSNYEKILTIDDKEEKAIPFSFVVNYDAPEYNRYKKTPSIASNIIIDNELISLEVGMVIHQPVQIYSPTINWWFPPSRQSVTVNLRNRLEKEIEGRLLLWSTPNAKIITPIIPVKLEGLGHESVAVEVEFFKASQESVIIYGQLEMSDNKTKVFETVKFVTDNPSVVTVGQLRSEKKIILQNNFLRALINLEGARCSIIADNYVSGLTTNILDFGPPFGFSEFLMTIFESEITVNNNNILIDLFARSSSVPNLVFHRYFQLGAGDTHITSWEAVENNGTVDDQVTIRFSMTFTEMIGSPQGMTYLSYNNKILNGPTMLWNMKKDDLPANGNYEPWICIIYDGYCYYHIYEIKDTQPNVGETNLTSIERTIKVPALSTREGSKNWFGISNACSWQNVKQLADYLVMKKPLTAIKTTTIEKEQYFDIVVPKEEKLIYQQTSELKVTVINNRQLPITGKLIVNVPNGWEISPKEREINNLTIHNPATLKFEVKLPSLKNQIEQLVFTIKTPMFSISKTITFFCVDGSPTSIKRLTEEIDGYDLYTVMNDLLEIKSSSSFVGSLTNITYKGKKYLITNFPKLNPSIFMGKYPAGLFTMVFTNEEHLDSTKFLEEEYHYQEVTDSPWYGIEQSVIYQKIAELRGLQMKSIYEILGGTSNLIRLRTVMVNNTKSLVEFASLTLVNLTIEGKENQFVSHFNVDNDLIYEFSRDNQLPIMVLGADTDLDYVTIKDKENPDEAISLLKDPTSKLFVIDASQVGTIPGFMSTWSLKPGEEKVKTNYIVLGSFTKETLEKLKNVFC